VADIVIRGNVMEGEMQGIFLGNHVRKGVDDGGFDRITIENNEVTVSFPQGIGLFDARDSVVRNNTVRTIPGSTLPNGKRVRANLRVTGTGNRVCGNKVTAIPKHSASRPCA